MTLLDIDTVGAPVVALLDIDAASAPVVALLDASADGRDEAALRARARELGAAVGADRVSRSYCRPYALVGWHSEPIGVDVERVVTCPPEFAPSISTPAELAAARWTTDTEIVSLWSSKEALSKALGDALDYDPRRLESPAGWPGGVCGPWRAATLPLPDGYCGWVCWRSAVSD
ncbi:MAG TPA: 4'-phosphopantetheinyl transferase superfamily protein [Solirubrobacteraceae bacterium]|nr:4'-phosphopantetheinyl transferase superfamily protein [Solirubrobacteraceae bacterium]